MKKYTVKKQGIFTDETIAILQDKTLAVELCKLIENGYVLNDDDALIFSNIDLPF